VEAALDLYSRSGGALTLARCGLACQGGKSGGAQISASGGAASRSRITDTNFIKLIRKIFYKGP
jgi:hypothetical protein